MTADEAIQWLTANGQEATPQAVSELKDFSADMPDLEFVPDPNEHLRMMGEVAMGIMEYLLPRPWWLIDYESPVLLTSDEPVALHFRDNTSPPGHGRGVAQADEIWFPLDPRRLLILGTPSDPIPEQRLTVSQETAGSANFAVAAGSYEYIFMHPDQDHLQGVNLPEPGPLFEVHAPGFAGVERFNRPLTRTQTQRRR
jgi:hypothetical protein